MMRKAFQFISDLSENNNREWFSNNKSVYDEIKNQLSVFFNDVLIELEKTDSIQKMSVYRIYRDIRFSSDKTPYKSNYGCSFTRTKPYLRGGYYIHLEPNNSFVACGFWNPSSADLNRIRKEIELDSSEIRDIISSDVFVKHFGFLQGEEVKTAPKGFNINHPDIDLIKKKQYLAIRNFSDQEVFSENFKNEIISSFTAIRPFFDLMSSILSTNSNGEELF